MDEIQVFTNELFGKIRVVIVDGKEMFVASDVAKALGYARPNDAVNAHCRHTVKRSIGAVTGKKASGEDVIQQIEMNIISEGDMFRLITHSKLHDAERFESWVFDEVLPSIRKNGGYVSQDLKDKLEKIKKDYYKCKHNKRIDSELEEVI